MLVKKIKGTIEGKDKLIEILADAVQLGMDALPVSVENARKVRKQLEEALEIYRAVKDASKGENDEQ